MVKKDIGYSSGTPKAVTKRRARQIKASRKVTVTPLKGTTSIVNSYGYHAAILSNASQKPESQMTALEKMEMVQEGVSKKDLEHLKEKAELDYDKLAKALSVTRATLINKQRNQKFGLALSEKIVGLADIYSYGYEVFEDEDKFNRWMFRANKALGGKVPYDLINNQFGREEVRNLIGRIEYGVHS